ncbi:MAG TPA: dihydrofolate reductase family protein [Candidatus Enterocloster faecavium]|uniref:Dihydrofolate reductase family protein n=1 Tax=Candidatus Enterocloster faecavium TaxID=2838560 RepID=A0A9D2RL33_9FIRM|nr:dihydrofolate reductase family protein [Candidatus Enterocloster faecavium]
MERDVILWARISADGFLADETGSLQALTGHGVEDWEGQIKEQLRKQTDTVILGRSTYDCLIRKAVPWPFEGMECYVATEEFLEDTEKVTFWPGDLTELVFLLKQQPGKGIWMAGGIRMMNAFLSRELADQYWLSVCPVFLGEGLRPGPLEGKRRLILEEALECDGVVTSIYFNRA